MAIDSLVNPRHDVSRPRRIGWQQAGDSTYAGVELRHLRYFLGLAEELHFGRAAARLYITQPGLSQAVARLEQELDVKLFERTHRNVDLTEAGAELVDGARRLLAERDELLMRVRNIARGEAGLIRLGVAVLAEPMVAAALEAFHHEHQEITFDRAVMLSERLIAQLQTGGLHAAVMHQLPALASAQNLEWQTLRRGRLAVVAGPTSALAGRESVRLSDLSDETFLVNPRSVAPDAFGGLTLMCREFGGFDPKVLESNAVSLATADTDSGAVRQGAAVVIVAEPTARAACPADLVVVPVEPPPTYIVALAWRREERSPSMDRFLNFLLDYRDEHDW